jgi:hypothetical protein
MAFAENTTVSAERSRAEIEETLRKYGADSFGYMTDAEKSAVVFQYKGRTIHITIPKPDGSKLKRRPGQAHNYPTDNQRAEYVEKENRRRWRALLLVIKAKLEAVATGIALFEDEFLAYVVMPNGQTVGEWANPQIEEMKSTGQMPKLLMAPAGGVH